MSSESKATTTTAAAGAVELVMLKGPSMEAARALYATGSAADFALHLQRLKPVRQQA
jgi:hypothetical protein